jgi:hypothetical protein
MNKNTMYIIVAVVVVIIIVAGVGVYLSGTGTSSNGTPTPTPTPVSTYTVTNATSLQFAANATQGTTTTTLLFAGENVGTANLTIRIDLPAYNQSYILNYGTTQSYTSTDSGKTWTLDSSFTNDNNIWGARWIGETHALTNWNGTGTTYTYTDTTTNPTTSVLIYNISINPSLPASLFATS